MRALLKLHSIDTIKISTPTFKYRMAAKKEYKTVVQSAIVIMPPYEVWDPIQEIRKVHDKAYPRWMPHINLIYPFIPGENFKDVVDQVKNAVRPLSPFQITLKNFKYFKHKGSCTMWLEPLTERSRQVHEVQSSIEKEFPYCNDTSSKENGFTPHLSVGQWEFSEITKTMKEFQDKWKQIDFKCSEVYMINRSDFSSPFEIYYRVPFGDEPVQELKPPPAPKGSKVTSEQASRTVFIGNLPFSVIEKDLEDELLKQGLKSKSITLPRKPGGGGIKGFGFVEFESDDDHRKALSLQSIDIRGRNASIQPSKQ